MTPCKASQVQQTASRAPLEDLTSNTLREHLLMPFLTLREDEQDSLGALQHFYFKQGVAP